MSEHGPLQIIIHIGAQGLAGYLVPLMLLLCGILLWFHPAQRAFNSLLAMMLALLSWITSDLGGFFIGMLLGLIGGALAFAWTTGPERQPRRRPHDNREIRQSSWGLALILRPMAALPPSAPAASIEADADLGSAGQPLDSGEATAPPDPAKHVQPPGPPAGGSRQCHVEGSWSGRAMTIQRRQEPN